MWDIAALTKVLLRGDIYYGTHVGFQKRLECIKFYLNAQGVDRLHAAMFRSGSIWSELGMRLAIDLANGGDGEYVSRGGLFFPRDGLSYRRLDWRVPLGLDDDAFAKQRGDGPAFDTLLYFQSRHPYFRIRSGRLKSMKIVVLTRSILDALESRYVKFLKVERLAGNTSVAEDDFDWDFALTRAIEFYNSWGDVLSWHPSIMHVKYEDLKADEVGEHSKILKFWGFDVPDNCIAEGLHRASKSEMNKRISLNNQTDEFRATTRGKGERGALSDVRKKQIISRLQSDLEYDLGYHYDQNTSYGAAYD